MSQGPPGIKLKFTFCENDVVTMSESKKCYFGIDQICIEKLAKTNSQQNWDSFYSYAIYFFS
jgi:hypothetical protein